MTRAVVTTGLTAVVLVLAVTLWPQGGESAAGFSGHLIVDKRSIGGACDDQRALDDVSVGEPLCDLRRAIEIAPPGTDILVRTGVYPQLVLAKMEKAATVVVRPYRDEIVTLTGVEMVDTIGMRLEGLRIVGRSRIGPGSSGIQLVGNDMSPQGISVRASSDVVIERNVIHDLTYAGPRSGAGNGILLDGSSSDLARPGPIRNVVIRGNTFQKIPADGIQMGAVRGVLIEDNEFSEIRPFLDPTEHADTIQLFGSSHQVTIRDNFIHDSTRGVIAKGRFYRQLRFERNLVLRLNGWALDLYNVPDVVIAANTIWDTRFGVLLRDLPAIPEQTTGGTVKDNYIDRLSFTAQQLSYEDYNVLGIQEQDTVYGPNDRFGGPPPATALRRGSTGVDRTP